MLLLGISRGTGVLGTDDGPASAVSAIMSEPDYIGSRLWMSIFRRVGTRVKATFKAAAGNPGCPSRERSKPGGALRDSIRSETGIVRKGESALGLLLRCERMV